MGFDLHTATRTDLLPQVDDIARGCFSIDTATPETAGFWYDKNPSCLIIASINGIVHGYADFLPLTIEAKQLIEQHRLKEEDIGPDHILPLDAMQYCSAIYFAGIAIRDRHSLFGARCAAALIAGCAQMLGQLYSKEYLAVFYTNPTTYSGNKLVQRLGLRPAKTHKTTTSGMDLYSMPMNDAAYEKIAHIGARYGRYISSTSWSSQSGTGQPSWPDRKGPALPG